MEFVRGLDDLALEVRGQLQHRCELVDPAGQFQDPCCVETSVGDALGEVVPGDGQVFPWLSLI
jgi:hypothetical protein